jgi:hypothetical protein
VSRRRVNVTQRNIITRCLCCCLLSAAIYSLLLRRDNIFAAYMFGALGEATAKHSAYSSLIQVLRSKTKHGFVPNYSAAGAKSQDRSEEIIGSKVLLELYKQYKEEWSELYVAASCLLLLPLLLLPAAACCCLLSLLVTVCYTFTRILMILCLRATTVCLCVY